MGTGARQAGEVPVGPVRARGVFGRIRVQAAPIAVVLLTLGAVVGVRLATGGAGGAPPTTIDGLTVQTVSAVLAQRASGELRAGQVAVGGYWSSDSTPRSCVPPDEPPGELELYCHDGEFGITQLNELVADASTERFAGPIGPSLTPWIEDAVPGAARLFTLPRDGPRPHPPVPVVVVGHFDDPRAAACRAEAEGACLDRLVVESIPYFDPETALPVVPLSSATAPPDALFGATECGGDVDYSFVGWTSTKDLGLPFERNGRVFAMVTAPAVLLGGSEWNDDPAGGQLQYRVWGRRICIAQTVGVLEFGWVRDTAYVEWSDGLLVPGVDLSHPVGGDR